MNKCARYRVGPLMALLLLLCGTGWNHSVQTGCWVQQFVCYFLLQFRCELHKHARKISQSVMGKRPCSLHDLFVCAKQTTRTVFTCCDHVPYLIFTSQMSASFILVILLICKTDGWKQTLSTNTYTGDMQCLHKSTWDTQTCKDIQSKMQTQLSHTHSSPPTPPVCFIRAQVTIYTS